MGCDIHFYTEKFTTDYNYIGPKNVSEDREIKLVELLENETSKPKWVTADTWKDENDGHGGRYWSAEEMYNNRNYYLFGILADVRNGDTIPISEPRGIPDDICYPIQYVLDQWSGDGHSASHFTLQELLNVDWTKYKIEWLSDFMETIEKMKKIDSDPNNVRCVFFFDN